MLEIRTLASAYFGAKNLREKPIPQLLALEGKSTNGEALFSYKCATCHKNGKGGNDIGPDLSSIGEKFDEAALLAAIIDPNASIVFGYEPMMVKTKEGQVFFGFLLSEGETTVLKDPIGQRIVIAPENIEHKERMKTGIMPSAAQLKLSDQDLADLSTYLLTLKNNL